jgi:hypothetical protein
MRKQAAVAEGAEAARDGELVSAVRRIFHLRER